MRCTPFRTVICFVLFVIALSCVLFGVLHAQSGAMVYLPLAAAPGSPFTPTFVATAPPTETPTATIIPPTKTPTPTATPPATVVPTPLTPHVTIKSNRFFTKSSLVYVAGEVANTGLAPAYLVKIQAKFFDANSQLLAVTDGYTALEMTSPGAVNPFKLILTNPPAEIAQYQLNLSYQVDGLFAYRPITVVSQQVRDNFGVEVFGELRNDAERTVRSPKIAVTFYDMNHNVVDVYSGVNSGDLAKAESVVYSLQTFSQIEYNTYEVQAQSYLAP